MVSLIKNQIIKHLSIFAKNLQPEQISLEVLGGTGELRNIVLNEVVLTEKLELPPFLKLKKAECNRVKVKVPWTKLSTSPVQIIVDELHVVLQLGHGKVAEPPKKSSSSNSYGFGDKVVEGLSIKVNVLDISFESDSFSGSLWLSPLIVESKSPLWQDVTSLKRTRISDPSCHQVIFFKQISWNLMKIQAFAHGKDSSDRGQRLNSPLRLITQGGKCRIAIKKDSNDGSLLAGRIQTIFDEIHWVATLAEVRSAISFYKHIMSLAKASSLNASDNPFLVDYSAKSRSKQQTLPNPAIKSTIFKQFDVGQTSHHVYINKVHMTLIDDHNNEMDYPSNWNTKSGAIQVTLEKITIDFYLQNLIADERRFWVRYLAPNEFTSFANGELLRHLTNLSQGMDPTSRERLNRLWSTLTSQTLVIRIDDIVVECVSEQTTKRDDLQDAFTSKTNSKQALPQPAFHFEFSNFFFPGSTTPEPPKPLAHIVVGPANILLDPRTIRWLLYVGDNITRTIDIEETPGDAQVVCARIDLLMPKLIIPCPVIEDDCRYPQKFVVNVSTVTISNRALENETFSVENLFQQLTDENMLFIHEICKDSQELRNHVLQSKHLAAELATNGASLDLLPTRWYISTSPLWMEAVVSVPHLVGKVLTGPTVISDVMLAGCIETKSPNIYVAVEPLNSLTVILDHFQFLQLMRVQKSISNLVEQLELDKQFFSKLSSVAQSENSPLSLYCFCDEINAHLILPIGLAPSPYELIHLLPKSDTATSISSDIPTIEKLEEIQSHLPQAGAIAAVTVTSTASAAPSPIPPVVIQTRDVELTDFGNNVTIADDLTSNFDSMSMISDDDSSQLFDASTAQIDDIFPEVAEEAIEVDEVHITKRQLKLLEKNVNALSATLSNFNVVVSTNNGKSNINGYALTINVAEELNVPLKNIFDKHRAPSTVLADKAAVNPLPIISQNDPKERRYKDAQLQFSVSAEGVGEDKYAHVIAKIRELNASLDEQVVSYLGPFVRDDNQDEDPLFLELSIENSKIQIINPKRKNPLRIRVGDIKVEDGEERKL